MIKLWYNALVIKLKRDDYGIKRKRNLANFE